MNIQNKNNRNYTITTSHRGLDAVLHTSLPYAKRAKSLTLKTGNKSLKLNGHQINTLKKLFIKENLINGFKTTM